MHCFIKVSLISLKMAQELVSDVITAFKDLFSYFNTWSWKGSFHQQLWSNFPLNNVMGMARKLENSFWKADVLKWCLNETVCDNFPPSLAWSDFCCCIASQLWMFTKANNKHSLETKDFKSSISGTDWKPECFLYHLIEVKTCITIPSAQC